MTRVRMAPHSLPFHLRQPLRGRSGRCSATWMACLADFERGVVNLTGYGTREWSEWDASGRELWAWDCEESWFFFAGLPWTRDGRELWKFLRPLQPTLLTGSPRGAWARPQKERWCLEQLGVSPDRVQVVHNGKSAFAGPGCVLVDDWEKYRQEWEDAGGVFILHTSTAATIRALEQLMGERLP